MGYLIGGRFQRISPGSEDEFRRLRSQSNLQVQGGTIIPTNESIPDLFPARGGSLTNKQRALAANVQAGQGMDITRTGPQFNDPRYTSSTLAIPTDERSLHGLYRFYMDTDPIVGNAIRMHVELPLSELTLGHAQDVGVDNHFQEMWQRINGPMLLMDMTSEYWGIGECSAFGAWNDADLMWDQIAILNPDYVKKESTWITKQPLLRLVPDESLRKIVRNQSPRFLYEQLPPDIIDYVIRGQDIPLDASNTFSISHNKAPYETRGKSIIKRILKILMYEDRLQQAQFAIATRHVVPLTVVKLGDPTSGWAPNQSEIDAVREMFSAWELDPSFCYDEQTECLTDSGWKKYTELSFNDKIASFNPNGNRLEYYHPSAITIQDYNDDMMRFTNWGMDMLVTPNHRMWVQRDGQWQIVWAENVKLTDKVRTNVDSWVGDPVPNEIEICGKKVNSLDWFEFVGWYLSEGGCDKYVVNISQSQEANPVKWKRIQSLTSRLPWKFYSSPHGFTVNNVEFSHFVAEEFKKGSGNKRIPRWMVDVDRSHLERLLDAHRMGDGSTTSKEHDSFYIGTISKGLANDLQEVALKLGWAAYVSSRLGPESVKLGNRVYKPKNGKRYSTLYCITCSKHPRSTNPGLGQDEPHRRKWAPDVKSAPGLDKIKRHGKTGRMVDWRTVDLKALSEWSHNYPGPIAKVLGADHVMVQKHMQEQGIYVKVGRPLTDEYYPGNNNIQRVPYKGKIWCVSVPTGIIVTRRGGRVAIQGQTLFYHWGINVEFYGSTGKILPLNGEFDRVYRLKFIGLGISEALLSGQSSTYASAFASLEVQRQRYLSLQLRLESLVHHGFFKPVAELCGFYKTNKLSSGASRTGKKWGDVNTRRREYMEQFTNLRDYQDNIEWQMLLGRKEEQWAKEAASEQREYIYPKLDWGSLSMASDEAYKSMLMNVKKNYPWLVSDEVFARVLKLDPKENMRGFLKDLMNKAYLGQWINKLSQSTGIPLAVPGLGGGPEAGGGGGIVGAPAKPGGPPTLDLSGIAPRTPGSVPAAPSGPTGAPAVPVGAGEKPPPSAGGSANAPAKGLPPGAAASMEAEFDKYSQLEGMSYEGDLRSFAEENVKLLKEKGVPVDEINAVIFGGKHDGNGDGS